jgi:hypothetical protein
MKTRSPSCRLPAAVAVATLLALPAAGSRALADPAGSNSDPVTGYHCLDRSCQTVTLPNADCVCVKENPDEQNVRKVVFQCSTKTAGRWVACPVKPRYGMSVPYGSRK